MNKRNDLKQELARYGQKVRIESRQGNTVAAQRLGGLRKGTLAVFHIDKLRPV